MHIIGMHRAMIDEPKGLRIARQSVMVRRIPRRKDHHVLAVGQGRQPGHGVLGVADGPARDTERQCGLGLRAGYRLLNIDGVVGVNHPVRAMIAPVSRYATEDHGGRGMRQLGEGAVIPRMTRGKMVLLDRRLFPEGTAGACYHHNECRYQRSGDGRGSPPPYGTATRRSPGVGL